MTLLKYIVGNGMLGLIGAVCCWLRLPIFACLALFLIFAVAFLFVNFPFWLRTVCGSLTGIAIYYAVFVFCVQILAMRYSDPPGKSISPREAYTERCGEYLDATMIPIGAGLGYLVTVVILISYSRLLKRRPKLEPAVGLVGTVAIILIPIASYQGSISRAYQNKNFQVWTFVRPVYNEDTSHMLRRDRPIATNRLFDVQLQPDFIALSYPLLYVVFGMLTASLPLYIWRGIKIEKAMKQDSQPIADQSALE